jgi:hypothetical protein
MPAVEAHDDLNEEVRGKLFLPLALSSCLCPHPVLGYDTLITPHDLQLEVPAVRVSMLCPRNLSR